MDEYNPHHAPDSAEWLEIPESERIDLVSFFHEEAGEKLDGANDTLHAVIHVVVENQVALGVESVGETIIRLMRQGLDRHEAIHAVGAVLSEDIYNLLKGGQEKPSPKQYKRRLQKLTAKRWRKVLF